MNEGDGVGLDSHPKNIMNAEERLLNNGYEGVIYLVNESYDDALIGVSDCGRAIYDYDLMIKWLMNKYNWTEEDSIEWVEYNMIRSLPYVGENAPIIMHRLLD